VYIPNGVHHLDQARAARASEEVVFTGGRTRRDYGTFLRAAGALPYPAVLVTDSAAENRFHGTTWDASAAPPTVRTVYASGSDWVTEMARAKVVVVPIAPGGWNAAGISTYLTAMALGKCVIATDSPATRGVVEHDRELVVVPPRDPEALAAAIREVWTDDARRARIAAAGRRYAVELGKIDDFFARVVQNLRHYLDSLARSGRATSRSGRATSRSGRATSVKTAIGSGAAGVRSRGAWTPSDASPTQR
jgi:glycosyltransferase involved in cell wall biosynthesis